MTSLAALSVGALVEPSTRKLFLGDINQDWIANELEIDEIDPDLQGVRLKNGGQFRVYQIRGTSYDAKVITQQEQMLLGRAALHHALGKLGIQHWIFGVKRQRDIGFEAIWPSKTLSEIGDAERRVFQSAYFVNWYVVVGGRTKTALVEACDKVTSMMEQYKPTLLSSPESSEEPCPLTCFVSYLVSGEYRDDLTRHSGSMSGCIPAADLIITTDGTITTRVPALKIHRTIAIRDWPENLSGQIFADILAIQGDLEIVQMCEPWDRDEAIALYSRRKKELESSFIKNDELLAQVIATLALLASGNTTVFSTQLQITARGSSASELDRLVSDICKSLGGRRIEYSVETKGAGLCWFARIPSLKPRRISSSTSLLRPLILREQNIAAIWPFHHSFTGQPTSPLGDRPVRYFRTPSGQAYAFQFHVSSKPQSKGHFLCFGPTGGGKTTLVIHILSGFAKFSGVRGFVFDSKEGARYMIEAMGGLYQGYDELQLNPLDVGDDTAKNRQRIYTIRKALAGSYERGEKDDEILAHAVELAFKTETPNRTLNTIFEFAFPRGMPLRRAIAPWVVDGKGSRGIRSHLMNAPTDSLGSFLASSHLVGINMNEALDDPATGPGVVTHISSAIGLSAARNSKGFGIYIDEAAKLLQNDGFKALAIEMFREYRKLDGFVGLGFQDPKALFDSGVSDAILDNTATLIFLPNSQARRDSLERFNLNEEQIGFILGAGNTKEGQRQALIVQRDATTGLDESGIIDVNLAILGNALRFYRSGPEANRVIADLKNQWGAEWLNHL
ncbi:MAG: VirB4 family type IV secretion system protein [Ferrovibrio sp.]|uniref:VirB4 family type IV secretion system protein n=1 Tax=Ferrovibrio sp. TaxID=1917215 RepID=UPI00391D2381